MIAVQLVFVICSRLKLARQFKTIWNLKFSPVLGEHWRHKQTFYSTCTDPTRHLKRCGELFLTLTRSSKPWQCDLVYFLQNLLSYLSLNNFDKSPSLYLKKAPYCFYWHTCSSFFIGVYFFFVKIKQKREKVKLILPLVFLQFGRNHNRWNTTV